MMKRSGRISFCMHNGSVRESTGSLDEDCIYRCHFGTHDAVASSLSQLATLKAPLEDSLKTAENALLRMLDHIIYCS